MKTLRILPDLFEGRSEGLHGQRESRQSDTTALA
jgi:hypothetical protein